MKIPELIREEPVIGKDGKDIGKYGKKVVTRYFLDPGGEIRDFMVWGGYVMPAIVLPVTTDGRVIALRMFRRAANKIILETPGGNPVGEELIEDCVRRELREETGYTAEKIIQIGPPAWFDPASCFIPYVPFLALDCQKIQEQELAETEVAEGMELELVELGKWIKMIHSGEIRDSKTITITFLALLYLGAKITINSTSLF